MLRLSMPAIYVAETEQRAWTVLVYLLGTTLSTRTAPKTVPATMDARRGTVPKTAPVSGGAVRLLMCAVSVKAMDQAALTAQEMHWVVPRSIGVVSVMTAPLQTAL